MENLPVMCENTEKAGSWSYTMKEYNTREIRAAAARLNSIADELQKLRRRNIPQIDSTAKQIVGKTGSALKSQSASIEAEITRIYRIVDSCADLLYEFARRLDIADQQISDMIR